MQSKSKKETISLEVKLSDKTVGTHLGISVPLLLLEIKNTSMHVIEVPEPGLPMLLSLRVVLACDDHQIIRTTGVGEQYPISMRSLPPGQSVMIEISPLDDGNTESPLKPGTYDASICVIQALELEQHTPFAEHFGGKCSKPVRLEVCSK